METDFSQLIADARRGNGAALERLLESFRNYLNLLACTGMRAVLRGKADPADVVQETLLKACRSFHGFRGQTEAELAGWLRQILVRTLTDLRRRFGREAARQRPLAELLDSSSAALGRMIPAKGSSPSAAAHRRELSVVLADALAALSPDYREVVVLRSIEERDWEDVARHMGRSEGAVRMLWTRALQQLRPLIEAHL